MRYLKVLTALCFPVFVLISCGDGTKSGDDKDGNGEVNIYTHRFYDSDKELYRQFESETGIEVNVKEADDDEIIAILQSEGEATTADLIVTVDAGRLHYAKELHMLQPMQSAVLEENIPAHLRDPENEWFGLTKRARVIVYNKGAVKPDDLSTYEDLADPKWKGQLYVASSRSIYNQSLMASIIARHGEEYALEWARGIVHNMARKPGGNDRDQIREVAVGHGKIAIVNSYYYGKMINSENMLEKKAVKDVGIFFPNQESSGAHINISGGGVARNAPHPENALRLLEFLSSEKVQKQFAANNCEFPIRPEIETSPLLQSWGIFSEDTLPLSLLGINNTKAVELLQKAGWN